MTGRIALGSYNESARTGSIDDAVARGFDARPARPSWRSAALIFSVADAFDQPLDTRIGREGLIRRKIGYPQVFRNCVQHFESSGRFLLSQ